jgi:hypothetical protein
MFFEALTSVEDAAAVSADEAGPADAACRIDGAAGVAALGPLHGIDHHDPGPFCTDIPFRMGAVFARLVRVDPD